MTCQVFFAVCDSEATIGPLVQVPGSRGNQMWARRVNCEAGNYWNRSPVCLSLKQLKVGFFSSPSCQL